MPSEGKVASLFIEFRTNINQLTADFQKLTNDMRSFGSTVGSVSKQFSDLGHLGSTAVSEVIHDIGRLTSGITVANTYVGGMQKSISDLGHLGGAAIQQITHDLGGLTAGLSTVNAHVASLRQGVADLGHLGTAAVESMSNDLGRLTAGLNTANTFRGAGSGRGGDIGLLGGAAVAELSNDLGGLISGLSTVNNFAATAQKSFSDLGHLGSAAVNQITHDLGGLTSGIGTANTFIRGASTGISDLGHLASASIGGAASKTDIFVNGVRQMSNELRTFDRIISPISRHINDIGIALSVGLTAPIVALGAYALKTSINFETAFGNVRKTLGGSEEGLAKLRGELIQLSTQGPTTATEFANIAAKAAQLGIEGPNIARFSQTMAELGAATKLSADDAANFLARFTNITHLPDDKIHNLASTLVLLGNKFPAVEGEIANFALRIAKVGSFVGLADADILAFATSLASVGVTAEQGGTAITRVFAAIASAIESNGSKLAEFAAVARTPVREFADLFKRDAAQAVFEFVKGLQTIKQEGGPVFGTLKALQLDNVRVRDTLLALAAGNEEVTKSLELARGEFEKNGELTRVYGERNKTTASQLKEFKNQVDALAISLGDALLPVINNNILPALKDLVDNGVKPAVEWFTKLSPSAQHGIEGFLLVAAAVGPAILIIDKLGTAVLRIGALLKGLGKLAGELGLGTLIGAEGFAGIVAILTAPVTIPWWLTAAFIAGVAREVYELYKGYDELIKLQNQAAQSQAGANSQLAINIQKLAQMGFDIPTGKSAADTEQLVHNIIAAIGKTDELAKAFGNVKPPQKLGPSVEELIAQAEAAEKLAKEHQKLIEKFTGELLPANALNEELSYLSKYFDDSEIVAVYAKQIVDATEAQQNHGIAVTGITAKLYDQAKAFENLIQKVKELRNEPVPTFDMQIAEGLPGLQTPTSPLELKALDSFTDAKKQINDLALALKNLDFFSPDEQIDLFNDDLDKAAKFAKVFHIELPKNVADLIAMKDAAEKSAAGTKAWEDAVNVGLKRADDMALTISATSVAVQKMADAGFADAQIMDIMGDVIDRAAEAARILGVNLDPVIANLKHMRDEMNKDIKEASQLEKEMTRVVANLITDLSNALADALIGAKSITEAAAKIGQEFARAFVKAVIAGIVAPLVEKFAELGRTLGKIIANAAAAHPVVAAVVGAVLAAVAVAKALGNTHVFANQFVKETQNPFAKSLTEFVNGAEALYKAGRQTYQGAQEAQAKVQELWKGFLEDAEKFGQQGRKQATVAQQAIDTLSPTIRRIFFEIQDQIDKLKPPSVRAVESTTAKSIYDAAVAANLDPAHLAALQEQANAINDQINYTMSLIAAQEEAGGSTAELNAQLQELVYQWDAVRDAIDPIAPQLYTFAEAVKSVSENLVPDKTLEFLDQVLNATSGAANLEQALGILEEIGTPVEIIIDRLGGDVANLAHMLELSGVPIPPLIQKYLDLYNATQNVSTAISKTITDLKDFAAAARAASQTLVPDKTAEFVNSVVNATLGAANLEDALKILDDAHTPFKIIIDRLGDDIENFANALTLSGLPIPPLIEKYLRLKQATEEAAGGMPRIANSLSKLVGDAVEKLRQMAGGGDLAQGILDALARLLTGLPEQHTTTPAENVVRDAVDKLRGVTEQILATLQSLKPQAATDLRTVDVGAFANAPGFATPGQIPAPQIVVYLTDNGVTTNEFTFTDKVSRETVRDDIIPEITEALSNNTDSAQEKWVRILRVARIGANK